MKRDKKFAMFIVFISFAVTGLLQYMQSFGSPKNTAYLAELERSLCVFDERYTKELSRYKSPIKAVKTDNIPSAVSFVEERSIIEEFTDEKQVQSVFCSGEPGNFIMLTHGMRVLTDSCLSGNISQFRKPDETSGETILSEKGQKIKMFDKNHQITHTVMAKDNLYNLAKRYYKDVSKWKIIYEANKNSIPDPHSLKIGQKVLIPGITVAKNKNRI